MLKPGIYKLKEEFWPMIGVASSQWNRRKEDLLAWWKEFFDYELLDGKPLQIKILEVYGEYQPLPRKVEGFNMAEKMADYERFTIASLGTEFKPNSKYRVAREAIHDFGEKKYGHTSQEAVARRFVAPAFDKYGESTNEHVWVWYSTYQELSEAEATDWRNIMEEERISETEASNAFYKQAQGEDISKELSYFAIARQRFKEKYGEAPILVQKWRVKAAAQQ